MSKRGVDYERLRLNKEFQHVYSRGRRVAGAYLIAYGLKSDSAVPRFGVSVSRKVGKAAVRNRVRRLIRESFFSLAPKIGPGWEFVICARPSSVGISFEKVRAELRWAVSRILRGKTREGSLLRRMSKAADKAVSFAAVLLLLAYKKCVSPLVPRCCRFEPSCSEYAIEAFRKFGVLRAARLTAWRLLRCHPFCAGGFDPLPEQTSSREAT
ncbi:MAG: membrane protein insertion efficiency factor YidD [Candidatus Coatesbacteria bacterium]|nr:membrane protein insertion efficiency factor YidD [Candidatus Coatesbacteria bacterium]